MDQHLLLCTDLDGTLLPRGDEEESEHARPLFRRIVERPEVTLAYVTGRDKGLLIEAIETYDIPVPDYAIGDVGTTLYDLSSGDWQPREDWTREIASDWNGRQHGDLVRFFENIPGLRLQEPEKQNQFKVSYYVPIDMDTPAVTQEMQTRLRSQGVRASLIWSVDAEKKVGLLDVLPEHATKLHASRFVMGLHHFPESRTVFVGDSGNDLPAVTSGLQAVLVRNTAADVQEQARKIVMDKGLEQRLYIARGGFLGMNGNYAAGILEGLAHYIPETEEWMRSYIK